MAHGGALRNAPVLLLLTLFFIIALGCSPALARPSSGATEHHHHGHHHYHHRHEEKTDDEAVVDGLLDKVEETPPIIPVPPKPVEIGDVDHEDEEYSAINDAEHYFSDDADLLRAAAGAVEAHLKAEEDAARRKSGTTVRIEGEGDGETLLSGDDGAVNGTASEGTAEDGEDQSNSPAKQTRESQETPYEDRTKKYRIASIKEHILKTLNREPDLVTTNRSIPLTTPVQQLFVNQVYKRMSQVPQWPPSDLYTEKVQSFYPSCELPRNTDDDMWHGPNVMNLLFNLSFPVANDGSNISIVAAKLRLFKLSQGNSTAGLNSDGCPPSLLSPSPSSSSSSTSTPESEIGDGIAAEVIPAADEPMVGSPASPLLHSPLAGILQVPVSALQQDDRRIRVSVYWYTHSLKKHRAVKRKLLDSQMVSVSGPEEWVEFDVRNAARVWKELGHNFGLVVEVEDEDGAVLPAEQYFAAMNCSKEASTSRPFPGFLFDAAREAGSVGAGGRGGFGNTSGNKSSGGSMGTGVGSGSRALGLDTHLFPLMDLCTIQYPEGEEPHQLLPSLSSPSAFGLPFGRRSPLPAPPAPPVVMVACGGAGAVGQTQIVPAIHPVGGRNRPHRRPDDKSGSGSRSPEERGNRRRGQEEDNDATATNQLSQRRDDGEVIIEGPVVDSPSAIQVTKIRHPRRHLEGGHGHRAREGRRSQAKERIEPGRDVGEEEDEEVREERVSWQDSEGRQHVKTKVVVHKMVVSHREGEDAVEEEGEGVDRNEGKSIAMVDHRGR